MVKARLRESLRPRRLGHLPLTREAKLPGGMNPSTTESLLREIVGRPAQNKKATACAAAFLFLYSN